MSVKLIKWNAKFIKEMYNAVKTDPIATIIDGAIYKIKMC